MDTAPPVFEFEVRYFRNVLRVSYETGRRLREREILKPDAFTADGRALYRIDAASVKDARERINRHRAQVARTRYNLPPLCPEKPITV